MSLTLAKLSGYYDVYNAQFLRTGGDQDPTRLARWEAVTADYFCVLGTATGRSGVPDPVFRCTPPAIERLAHAVVEIGCDADGHGGEDRVEADGGVSVEVGTARPAVDVKPGGGPNVERNRKWRAERRALKKRRQARVGLSGEGRVCHAGVDAEAGCTTATPRVDGGPSRVVQSPELVASYEERRIAENALATENARRRLEVAKAIALEDDVRRQRTRVAAMTEHNMVSIERDHAKLKVTGNVPGLPGGGFAETVLTDGDTISPNSSASMADYRKCQKDLLDSQAMVEKLAAALEERGVSVEHVDKYSKSLWTDDIETFDALDEMYGEYVLQPDEFSDKLRLVDTGVCLAPLVKSARAGEKDVRRAKPSASGGGEVNPHYLKSDGTPYTQLEALRWLGSYAYAGNKLDCGKSDADVAKECSTTVGVLQKYRSLKAKFDLFQ